MKYLLYGFHIFLLIIIASCQTNNEKKEKHINALKYSSPLKVNKIYHFNNDIDILNPFRILNVNDEYLIVSELRQNNFFHLFSLPDLTFLYSSGKKGRGPTEFIVPPMNLNIKRNALEIYDPILKNVRYFNVIDTALIESRNIPLRFKGQIEPLNRVISINDSTYFADYGSSVEQTNSEYIALRPTEEDSLFTFGEYPPSDLDGFERYSHFLKTNASRTKDGRFAAFYIYYNRFKIYNDKGNKLVDFLVDDPTIHFTSNNSNKYMYRIISQATENYIYSLGIYNSEDKIYDNPDANLKTSIEVWSWDGKPIYRASFDRLIHGFTVSEKYKKIYGYSNQTESTIFEYNLNILD